jgi:predicted PurR-regulated permease PerM
VGAEQAQQAGQRRELDVSDAFHALLNGLGAGISALASLAIFLSFTALSLFFLLKDGPQIRAWTERHMGSRRRSRDVITAAPWARCRATSPASPRSRSSTRS